MRAGAMLEPAGPVAVRWRSAPVALLLLLLLAPAAARGQVSVGVRVGYAAGAGSANAGVAMRDWVGGQVPIQADLLVRVSPRAAVGAYASYGFGLAGGDAKFLCEIFGCTLGVARAGVQATYELPRPSIVPWVGAGVGYEWSIANLAPNRGGPASVTFGGPELHVQGGADWTVGSRVAVGPFAAASLGRYAAGTRATGEAADRTGAATHAWIQLGLRARFGR